MANGDLLWYDQVANLDLFWPGGPRLHGLSAEVHIDGVVLSLPGDDPHCQIGADRAMWQLEGDGLQVVWRWQSANEGLRSAANGWDVWLEVTNTGRRAVQLNALDPLRVLVCDMRTSEPPVFYQHGWGSETPTFARQPADEHYMDPGTPEYRIAHQPHYRPGYGNDLISEWVTIMKSSAGSLLVGFVTAKDQLASVQLEEPQLITRCWLDGAELKPGGTVRSERLWIKVGNDPVMLLEEWAERLGSEMNARLGRGRHTGWCTWYHFFGTNDALDVEANLVFIEEHDLPLDVILVDDGYQTAIGDWLSVNSRFPKGMRALADRIRASGRTAGIWTAPFGAAADSQMFTDHPDWFIRDEHGQPIVAWRHQLTTDCYALDPTHPEVGAWLAETFRTMRQEWGYEVFKIDFIFAAAVLGRRYDPASTRASSLRRGVGLIRQAVGDDAFVLASGAPQGVCVGLVDSMRVGPAVAPYWSLAWSDLSMPAHQNALRNSIARAPFHNRLWLNDPDCLIVRRRDNDSGLSFNEVRSQVSLVALLGGLTLDSDDLTQVRPGRLKYLHQALPPSGVSARPLDLFDHELPRTLVLRVDREWGRWWVVGLVNWGDHTVTTTVRLGALGLPPDHYHVYDYWRRRYLGLCWDEIAIPRHRSHETLVLLLKPASEKPDLLTTTFHVCQGAVELGRLARRESADGVSLQVVLEKAGRQFGELLFTVPEGWQAVGAYVDGRRRRLTTVAPTVVGLGLTLAEKATVSVDFVESAGGE